MPYRVLGVALAIAVACLGAPARSAPTADTSVAALLLKHRTFAGWQLGDGTFKTLLLSRRYVDADGNTTQVATERRAGLIYRTTTFLPHREAVTDDAGFTGNVFWTSSQNGFTTPLYGDLAKQRYSYDLLFNEGTTSLPGESRGTDTIDGKPYANLRLDVPQADPIDLDVDPETGAYVRAIVDPGGRHELVVHILSYVQVSGKRLIGSYRIGDGPAGTYTYSDIEPNVSIADAELHPPAARARWTFANDKPFPIATTIKPSRVLVDATVNGVKGHFIVDTGANAIFLNERFAERAKVVKVADAGIVVGISGAQRATVRRVATMEIGGNTLSNVLVEAQDFNSSNYWGLDDRDYDGLLGYDFFAGAVVTLETAAKAMTIADPSLAIVDPQGLGVLVDTSNRIPTVPMTLNKTIAVNAMLDTGDPGVVVFGPDILYKYHLRMARSIGTRVGAGSVECGNIESLQLGPIAYGGAAACKVESGLVSGRNVLVGLDFLQHFGIQFDYPHGRMFFQPAR
jgi:Aspartyl protease